MKAATKVNGMSKPKRNRVHREFGLPDDAMVSHIAVPKRYVPPKCSACTALRTDDNNFTEVYSVKREAGYVVRYCRCRFCGNTFKDLERVG